MSYYDVLYRMGLTPWERYGRVSFPAFAEQFDRVTADRPDPPGRALDLGCGRGMFTPELAERGWEAVGVDAVPRAIAAAKRRRGRGAAYLLGDVTRLEELDAGRFDLFVDIGCHQVLDAPGRAAEARGATALANPGATLLMLEFGPVRFPPRMESVSQPELEETFSAWDLVAVEPAPLAGLGWPMNRTSPQWYRFALRG